ncbi:LOW QUALITY PROTEIN: mediator of RNA polymerase II transcription subunit 7-like [Homalodisca vitripennis]|uniref:LOW QUALITY PROTEIN: mediator of RNA polymerase II transcription subunit 7-like n=1 Tax=Homalodisca vitripennis TaxID=197043 RepID=UPI001EEAA96F|nr:LOW QUALITY PROTEIN: mediator of RNA polymerase II transcription subunit 7-like [Homalodisca vitripennis]
MSTTPEAAQAQVSSLPLPPVQYINVYTDENVKRGRAPKPPPPVNDSYKMFGNTYSTDDAIIRPLETQGFKRLYPQHYDRKRELRKLNHSLFVNFLDLLDLLVRCPDSTHRTAKVEDLSLLFIHIHHLLNEFRPHQARETLRVMLELQRRQRVETAQRFQKHLEKVREILHQAMMSLPDMSDLDSKLTVPVEIFQAHDTTNKDETDSEGCDPLDRLMCEIVDQL